MTVIAKELAVSMEYLGEQLQVDRNFDVIQRVLVMQGKRAAIYCIDGFTKDEILEKLMEFMLKQTAGMTEEAGFPVDGKAFSEVLVPYGEVSLYSEYEPAMDALLSGMTLLVIDGYDQLIGIDCRTYPARGVSEPEKDKTMRGARDGFVETLVFNTALMRRRIRDRHLIMEMHRAGRRSKTDICLCYLDDLVDRQLLETLQKRIDSISTEALTMSQESLAECIYPGKWFNPFPKFKFTERPDAATAAVMEGNVVILVDNSPSAMIVPSSLFDIVEEAQDYYFPPVTGTYLRMARSVISLLTYLIPTVYLLTAMHPEWLPGWLEFTAIQEEIHVPVILQLLILEIALDGLRLAAINTPGMLSTPLSITAGLVLGEFSVKSGWFNAESMLYMAFVFVANYSQSSYEFGYAIKFMRMLTLILTALFDVWGFAAGAILFLICLCCNRTVSGYPYLYPVLPFSWKKLRQRFWRHRIQNENR